MKKSKKKPTNQKNILGISQHINDIEKQINAAAKTDSTVLIQGPTGTGKELIAKEIHKESNKKQKEIVIINCGAIPSELFESELFGHKKGSFTGAVAEKIGKVKLANGGTLFLDEIGDLSPYHQVKILRFIESGEYTPVGGTETEESEARIIAATNKTLHEEIEEGRFREDLFYRLAGYEIYTKPLSERPEDIIEYINLKYQERITNKKNEEDLKSRFLLYAYSFPGNFRELKMFVKHIENKEYSQIKRKLKEACKKEDLKLINSERLKKLGYADAFNTPQQDLKDALDLIEKNEEDFKKYVRAYEIITLIQNTNLLKEKISETLKIRKASLSPKNFKSKYEMDFPYKDNIIPTSNIMSIHPSPEKYRGNRNIKFFTNLYTDY